VSLASQITALADRVATEFNAVRGEFASLISGFQTTSEKGAANGYASLDSSSDLTLSQLPVHAGSHATAGSDPVTPAAIGAATTAHVHNVTYNLAYAATLSADWNNGNHQYTTLTGDAIIGVPTNIPSGAALQYTLYASAADRTITIDSGIARVGVLPGTYVIPTGTLIRLTIENNPRGGAAGAAGPLLTALGAYQPLDSDLTDIAALTGANDDVMQKKAGHWVNRTIAQLITDLTSGLSALFQPLDSDLTTLASLTATTNNFIVSVGSAWASRTPAQAKTALAITAADVTPTPAYSFTYAATYAPNWANGEHHYCTSLTGDITIQEPTNIPSGKALKISMIATTAPRTVTVDSTILRLAGINAAFVVETGKMLELAIENNPALFDTILIAKGGN